ncbi:T9SS type A sorting domain-containing protein [Patiriisocius marinus]|uniref:Uncharacterized protein n=1 Tax=Patiriisocius marinus TaxID=1397112 RepID=A0A5J4IUW2_9FLAO|nr:T9SS type A sorting domain-containing protein [Patiriisocius marinus]GER57972.1 hypothetical protein ULMA_00800 [Patiriisocius marinus]
MKTLVSLFTFLITLSVMAQEKMFVHTATSENINGNFTIIDHPDLNENPNACLTYNHYFNPEGVYNNNIDGLWYNSGASKWTIYNENFSEVMVENASFAIYIADEGKCFDHIAVPANIFGAETDIDHPELNNSNPGPYTFFSSYYNPNAIYNPSNYGMNYVSSTNKRSIFSESITTIPEDSAYKILIATSATENDSHTTSVASISGNGSVIDNPYLNNNPNALFVFTHYYGLGGASSEVLLDSPLGIYYDGSHWSIFREDLGVMPENVVFDIAIMDREILAVETSEITNTIALYPNPAIDNIQINGSTELTSISIFNILGQQVLKHQGDSNSETINISHLPQGIYIAKVVSEDATQSIKFQKK